MRPTVLLLAVVLLAACRGDDSSSGPDATDPPAPTLAAPAEPVELPTAFPNEVPVPAEVELANAEEHAGDRSTIFEVTGWYDGDPIRIARDYEQVLVDRGFEITSRTESPDNLFLVAESEAWYVSAGFFPDPIRNVGTSVGLTVAPAG